MQLEYGETQDSYMRARHVGFQLPAKTSATPHRDPVLRVLDCTPADGSFICCSQDGLITSWSPTMQLRRCKSIVVSASSCRAVSSFTFIIHPLQRRQLVNKKWETLPLLISLLSARFSSFLPYLFPSVNCS